MGRIPTNTRELLVETYPLRKKDTKAQEPEWILHLEEWGAEKEKEDLTYTRKKRDTLQKEIDNKKMSY